MSVTEWDPVQCTGSHCRTTWDRNTGDMYCKGKNSGSILPSSFLYPPSDEFHFKWDLAQGKPLKRVVVLPVSYLQLLSQFDTLMKDYLWKGSSLDFLPLSMSKKIYYDCSTTEFLYIVVIMDTRWEKSNEIKRISFRMRWDEIVFLCFFKFINHFLL